MVLVHSVLLLEMNTCEACGSILENIEYQARSGDEAQRMITTCVNCPLDCSKMSFRDITCESDPRFTPFDGRIKTYRLKELREGNDIACLTFKNVKLRHHGKTEKGRSKKVSVEMEKDSVRHCNVIWHGSMKSRAIHTPQNIFNLPYCRAEKYSCEVIESINLPENVKVEGNVVLCLYNDCNLCFFDDENGVSSLVVYVEASDKDTMIKHMWKIMNEVLCIERLDRMVSNRISGSLIHVSPRAWDVTSAQATGLMATHKVYGERSFIIIIGPVKFVTRRNRSLDVVMWSEVRDPHMAQDKMLCLDTEFSIIGGFYLIDV